MDRRLYQKGVVLLVGILCQLTVQAQTTNQQWRDSLTVLNKMIDTQPWSTDLHLRKAAVNLELKQWQYAIDEYAMILQKEPHNPAALFYRAYANTHLRHFDLAKNDLNDLLIVVPNHFEARLSLAIVLQQLGRKQEALDNLNQLIQQHADSAVAYAARANLERQMSKTMQLFMIGNGQNSCRLATQHMWLRTSICWWYWSAGKRLVECLTQL